MRKVIFIGNGGTIKDRLKAKLFLKTGKTYHLKKEIINNWDTEYYLEEFPNIGFNSVLFE